MNVLRVPLVMVTASAAMGAFALAAPREDLVGPASTSSSIAGMSTTAATTASLAQAAFDRMTPAQRVGQLFMVGTPVTGISPATASLVTRYHVGNVILTGRTTSGAPPVRALTARADTLTTGAATAGVPVFVATDQEGGYVQVLQGPGFSRMPTALTQGTWSDTTLAGKASTWGGQVRRSGVDVDLAPVMDTVSAAFAPQNAPIGRYDREYGHTPSVVADKGTTFLRAMRSRDLAMTAKHFPGLGRVTGNTDTTAGVTDRVTTRTSADLVPFRAAVAAGARFVMVSSAYYAKIDPHNPAVFSPTVVTGMIRGDLAFRGVVVSDDLSNARQVQAWTAGSRALKFLDAGGDLVLAVNPATVPAMVSAVMSRYQSSASFRARAEASVLRVLQAKAAEGLLAPRLSADGHLGSVTVTALQRWLGVTRTGRLDATTVRALQRRVGTVADGVWGPASMAALQSYLGTYRDGAGTWNSRTVTLLQRYLNTQL
ncbi:glycoside hydrolase family 3 N-terminal domain-containing protein [Pedococcus sp. 5OH_020]|uniref:glycoside hydrolase family 3 N-terminal domain-containing protein n=1 Tax=Pedococcus sp. 5OH_020 TaxID=2989814 RepID=UPI0022E9A0FD|nr:glycoside hydrolase family 3 N-terminal domain-containing protein [Pedococcus sp. 5OH_020]